MKIKIDNRFPELNFFKDVKILFEILCKEKHVIDCINNWKNHDLEELKKTYSGGTERLDYLLYTYHFSPQGLTISYSIFHEILWDELFQNFDCEDCCTLDVTYSSEEILKIINKTQLTLF